MKSKVATMPKYYATKAYLGNGHTVLHILNLGPRQR